MRREFPGKVKVVAFNRAQGRCEHVDADGARCDQKLGPGNVFYDHIIADGLTGEPTLSNCQCLCKLHHDRKTREHDVPAIARAKRRQAKHINAKPRSSRPMPCGRNSKFKRTIDGRTILR